jgi:hypothetical protein
MEDVMAKARSPSYPAISLKEAIEKIGEIYKNDYQNPISREVAGAHMGYKSLHGNALGVLSALVKYGLLEGRGDNTRVSDWAVNIIAHPPGSPERVEGLKLAATRPKLFAELETRFPGGKASDQAIRSYLLTQKYIPAAADAAIRSYRETKQLVEAESGGYTAPEPEPEEPSVTPQTQTPPKIGANPLSPAPPMAGAPLRVVMNGDRLDIQASVDLEGLKKLRTMLEKYQGILEMMQPEKDEAAN